MEVLRKGKYTEICVCDEKGAGNANHAYVISSLGVNVPTFVLGQVNFQNGPILETGVNGVTNEDLLAIVIHRLQGFQSGDFKCRENAIALTKCEEALLWLEKRTADREKRGVEGKSIA
jgi:hypothetical protein